MGSLERDQVGLVLGVLGALLILGGAVAVVSAEDDPIVVEVGAVEPTPLPTPTVDPVPEPTATPEPQPTATAVAEPTATPQPEPTATPEPTEVPVEDPEVFLGLLVQGLRDDADFLVSRLNQATLDRYGEEQCSQNLPSLLDPTAELTLREFGDPGPWEYVTDALSTTIDNALPVEVSRIAASQTLIQELHWQLVDGQWTWFTDCGTPL